MIGFEPSMICAPREPVYHGFTGSCIEVECVVICAQAKIEVKSIYPIDAGSKMPPPLNTLIFRLGMIVSSFYSFLKSE